LGNGKFKTLFYLIHNTSDDVPTTGGIIALGITFHQQEYRPSDSNKNIDVMSSNIFIHV